MKQILPANAKKYFWGDNLDQLNWSDHKKYIMQTLLDKGDKDSISWLLQQSSFKEILDLLPSMRLAPKSRNFWNIYLS